jgi:sigma-54 dependent transcriptional regulator, acetoin dehydrogenase operon transcriptional activator AcoR
VKAVPLEPAFSQAPQSLQALGDAAIQQALEAAHGNVSLVARQLGISRQTLYRKLRAAG